MKKLITTIFILLIYSTIHSQNCGVFFSEYLEGSSNNKAIEVYNNTGNTINLTDYTLYRFNNGSATPTDSLFPQGTLAQGAVWVAGNPSAVANILNVSDTLHTITFFNGDDVLMLKNSSTGDTLDIIGIIGNDPGTNWPVGTGATSEFTLVRMATIMEGTTNWAQSVTQWDVHPQNTFTFIGNHTANVCCVITYSNMSASACDSMVSPSGNYVWTSTGIYKDTLQNAAGCDSIITVNLSVNYSSIDTVNALICNGDTYTLPGGQVVSLPGTYIDTLLSNWGCDSIIYTFLSVAPVINTVTNITACDTVPWMGFLLTVSGTYIDTLIAANGCDSIVTLNLTITIIDVTVTTTGATLSSNQNGATYQWINCNNNTPINGATNQSYTATSNGSYAVIITLNGCVDTSACYSILNVGIGESNYSSFTIYPNPFSNAVYITGAETIQNIQLVDVSGRKIIVSYEKTSKDTVMLNLENVDAGVYFITIATKDGITKTQRIIKK